MRDSHAAACEARPNACLLALCAFCSFCRQVPLIHLVQCCCSLRQQLAQGMPCMVLHAGEYGVDQWSETCFPAESPATHIAQASVLTCPGGSSVYVRLAIVKTVAECAKIAAESGYTRVCLKQYGAGQWACSGGAANAVVRSQSVTNCNSPCSDGRCGGSVPPVIYFSSYIIGKSAQPNLHAGTAKAYLGCKPSMQSSFILQPTRRCVWQF